MAYDTTTLDLIEEETAPAEAAALARLDAGHPLEYQVTTGAAMQRVGKKLRSTSGSSETIGAGPLSFVLDAFLGWKQGDQVFISEDGDPESNYITGSLAADQLPAGDITVTVNTTQGSGTFTAWSLLLTVFVTAATVAPPFTLADGAFGADMAATPEVGRANVQVPKMQSVIKADFTQPGSPAVGTYLVLGPGAGGADWPGHEWEWATWSGSAWSFIAPANGDFTISDDRGEVWRYSATLDTQLQVGGENFDAEPVGGVSGGTTIISDNWNTGPVFGIIGGRNALLVLYIVSGAVDTFVTLPVANNVALPGRRVILRNKSGSQKKVNITGGGMIDDATEISIPDDASAELGIYSTGFDFPGISDVWTQLF